MSVDAVCLVWAYSTWTAKTEGGGGDVRGWGGRGGNLDLCLHRQAAVSKASGQ